MAETYSSRPFISYDGPDEDNVRAEVKVVTGFGTVDSIETSKAGKSQKVSFSVENTDYKSAGWAPVDSNVMTVVKAAEASGEPIYFRIETRRKDNIDRTTPINELTNLAVAKDSIHKSLAAVKPADDEDWTISQFAVTNMAEDPRTRSGTPSANDYTAEELRKMSGKGDPGPARHSSHPASWYEPPPFQTFNDQGEPHPGSMAVAVPLNIYSFLTEYFTEREVEVDDRTKFAAVKLVMAVCNEAQLGIYEGEHDVPNLSAGSHTRARALVFESLRIFYPLTAEILADEDAKAEWKENTLSKILKMWKWSINEVSGIVSK